MSRHSAGLRRFFADQDGKIVIWQTPNVPLWAWIVLAAISHAFHGKVADGLHRLADAFLFLWAYQEIRSGASWFRRTAGAIVFLFMVIRFFL